MQKAHVTRLEDADWHGAREGSDTAIIHSSQYKIGDTFFVTVNCAKECQFDIKMNYAREYKLNSGKRQIYRWGGHETNILKYPVPPKLGANLETEKFEIHLEPEVDYKNIQVHISHDRLLQAVEDKPEVHLTDKGLSVQMNSKEKMWCTKCYFYLIVTMEEDRRLYATAEASSLGQLGKGIVQDIDNYYIANEGRWECDIYTVTSAKNDVMITISNW